ncbi:MAG TPA: hypothetical protein VKY73_17515 [Polyangiaceae bacterium]|nr:hypothetical protein [Polyangiaceae bacterium]
MSLSNVFRGLAGARARAAGVALVLLAGFVLLGWVGHRHYPIQEWLFFRYAGYWLAVLLWAASSTGVGALLLERVVRVRLRVLEQVSIAFVLGVFAFEWAMFLLGAVQAYRKPIFFLVPLAFLYVGSPALVRLFQRVRRVVERRPPRVTPFRLLVFAFGFLAFGMVYFLVLTPENVQFDSRWKHMALAEDYVVHGGLRRATEGWAFSARPHMTSYLFVWAFLAPKARLFDQMVLSAHLEFFTFAVTTLVGIPALVRRLVPSADPSVVWAARFLFPGIFLYDSSVSGGTDHFGALYAPVIAVTLFEALRRFEVRRVALVACLVASAVMVKETAALLLAPFPIAVLVVRWGMEAVRAFRQPGDLARKRALWLLPTVALGVGLLVSIPFWLKNVVFYQNPVYPSLSSVFPSNPWSEAAAYKFKWGYQEGQMWAPSRDLEGVLETFAALFTFSFIPNDWPRFHRDVPVFGSLFTLLLPVLPFLRGTRRLWLIVLWVHLGIFAWYSVHHQDRYLQGILPLMAACVAATLVLVFRTFGAVVKSAAAALVGLQIVWGGDVYFIQTHAMIRSPIKEVVDLLSGGFERKYERRLEVQEKYRRIGAALPKDARVLFHEHNMHLGVGRETVLDKHQWQFAIDYAGAGSPEAIRKLLLGLGVTHAWYVPERSDTIDSLAGDLLFHEFAAHHTVDRRRVGGGVLVRIPERPLEHEFRDEVVVLSCRSKPEPGLYRIRALARPPYGPSKHAFGRPLRPARDFDEALALLPDANFVVLETRCRKRPPRELTESFQRLVKRKREEIWRVKRGHAPALEGDPEPDEQAGPEDDPEAGSPWDSSPE